MPPTHLLDTSVFSQPIKRRPVQSALDLLIAATAKTHNLVVATLNLRDFEKIPGLTLEDWSQT